MRQELRQPHSFPENTMYLLNICTMLDQRRRRWSNIVHMLYKCFVFAGLATLLHSSLPSMPGSGVQTCLVCALYKDVACLSAMTDFNQFSTLVSIAIIPLRAIFQTRFTSPDGSLDSVVALNSELDVSFFSN